MKILKLKNIIWNTFKKLANLNLSIFMLLLIALISIIGTIIEQDQDIKYYQLNYPIKNHLFDFINWKVILSLGIDHIYTNWWFISMLILFFLSLFICTLSTQLPSLNNSRNWKFLRNNKNIKNLIEVSSLSQKSLCNMIFSLNSQDYYVFHKGQSIYAYKGLIGRISPIFVHISIVLILIGAIIGLQTGLVVQEMIPCHEIFHMDNIIKAGANSRLPKNLLGKVDDFFIIYNEDNSIQQFVSYIKLIDYQGMPFFKKKIAVNEPLAFNGITLYQTDWQINSIRLQIGDSSIIQKKLNKVTLGNKKVWACNVPLNSNEQMILVIPDLTQNISLYNLSGELFNEMRINQGIVINNTSFNIKELIVSTGLQIKTDPGIIVVYMGFFILLISVTTSYSSYSQIWVTSKKNNLSLAGSTNRAALSFEEDFASIQQIYMKYTSYLFRI